MSSTVIKIENVSKLYRLGEVGTGTLSHDLNRWWHRVRGLEDPCLKIGQVNDRTVKGSSDYAWALRDVSFNVPRGGVTGVIGRNGAGKSTLLKILSRVTAPTSGRVLVKGRIASLLEVGTGFHPELTGRENVFLNGAILGMREREIARKFAEIVAFAGVERYIDTPVKRYSSGMHVRLAFAVAAHLEPEILIVDEVLAVGDAEFQNKCLGKLQDVAGHGRTIIMVSHNLGSILSLCETVVWLANGQCVQSGPAGEVVNAYQAASAVTADQRVELAGAPRFLADGTHARITALEWLDGLPLRHGCTARVRLEIAFASPVTDPRPGLGFATMDGTRLVTYLAETPLPGARAARAGSVHVFELVIDDLPLNPGMYALEVSCREGTSMNLDYVKAAGCVDVVSSAHTPAHFLGKPPAVRLAGRWQVATTHPA